MPLLKYDLRAKKKQWAESALQGHKRLVSRVEKSFTFEDDQPASKRKRKSRMEISEGWKLRSRGESVIETEKKFLVLSEEDDERQETEMNEDKLEAGNDDDLREVCNEKDDNIPQNNVDDVRQIKLGRESDRAKRTPKVGAPDTPRRSGVTVLQPKRLERKNSGVEHVDLLEQTTSQFGPLDDTVQLQIPAGFEEAIVLVEHVDKQ